MRAGIETKKRLARPVRLGYLLVCVRGLKHDRIPRGKIHSVSTRMRAGIETSRRSRRDRRRAGIYSYACGD